MKEIKDLLSKMTLREKIELTSGQDSWRLKGVESLGIPKITVCDGPHGLRHQEEGQDHLGINESNPSTCFPPACLSAASFDEDLLFEMGKAIGYEALCQNVQVVLGPGVNIKRNPLCGRNFEYFSEDPLLAGKMASAWIKGVQTMGVGTSLKHFALNSQEMNRMKSDSIADDKAKFDIYLKAFEEPLKAAKPWTVMGSYNLVDGIYASENKWLLQEVLRNKYGFQGVLMTDWGAMNDKTSSFKAGLDLEMPGSNGYFDQDVEKAISCGDLEIEALDTSAGRILKLITHALKKREEAINLYGPLNKTSVNIDIHHELARRVARESIVLLKNDESLLPINPEMNEKYYLVGALAKHPRYQGSGSSHINPYKVTSLLDAFYKETVPPAFVEGYSLETDGFSEDCGSFLQNIQKKDVVILAAGLPDSYESEGFDRIHMRLPDNQNRLITTIADKTDHLIVILFGGAPVEMPWVDKVEAILQAYLPGQAGGDAVADLVFGRENPSGKLPETFPVRYEDHITSSYYGDDPYHSPYLEGIYVGYRYFDKAHMKVQFPFGHGLSYTSFNYSKLSVNKEMIDFDKDELLEVRFFIKNTGKIRGKEVCQLYLKRNGVHTYSIERALKAFQKIDLAPGEEREVKIILTKDDFKEYDLHKKDEILYSGEYVISIGTSSRDLPLNVSIGVIGTDFEEYEVPSFYMDVLGKPDLYSFQQLIGREVPASENQRSFTIDHTLEEMSEVPQMKLLLRVLEKILLKAVGAKDKDDSGYKVVHAMFMQTPIKRLSLVSPDKMPKYLGMVIVHIANGRYLKAFRCYVKRGSVD